MLYKAQWSFWRLKELDELRIRGGSKELYNARWSFTRLKGGSRELYKAQRRLRGALQGSMELLRSTARAAPLSHLPCGLFVRKSQS
jgi:hypothetical protein